MGTPLTAHSMEMPTDRSVWGVETDAFKTAFREYLQGMQGDDKDRDKLISRLMWCVDVWDRHRRKYFPDGLCDRPLKYPFFESPGQAGAAEEPAKYKLIGSAGQPSVIAIRNNLLMGTSDLTIWKSDDGERRLVLKKDHPKRDVYIERLIVHELLHQYLVESASESVRREYTQQTSSGAAANGGEFKTYKGHGTVFANAANYLNKAYGMPLLGDAFDPVPLRHYKVRNAAAAVRMRPSCSWFCTLDMFFAWDPDAEVVTLEQQQENAARMKQALAFYGADARGEGGAVVEVKTEAPPVEAFEAPFDESCFDVCVNELTAFDKENGTDCLGAFVRRMADFPVPSAEPQEIPPSARTDESTIQYQDGTVHTIDELMDDIGLGDVPTDGDTDEKPTLKVAYPLDRPTVSLARLEADLAEAKKNRGVTKAQFAKQRFGHPRGDLLSRHLKALREAAA